MRSPKPGLAEYSLRGYGAMIADRVRMDAYRDALARSVKPGDVVLDIGAGTGIMSLLACRFGARKVHAVEPSDALAVGRELAAANGYGDRIEFHYKSSLDLVLPERADVMVSDLRGIVPLYAGHLPSIVDARQRLLRPGGIQIPQRDTLMAQLVADPALYQETTAVWTDRALGLDLSAALRWATHSAHKADLAKATLLGTPRAVIELDYRTLESPNARGQAQWTIDADSTVHGLGLWFDATLVDGVGFSNAPDRPRAIYGQMFFPFSEPLDARRGQRVAIALAATRVGQDYVWQWDATVTGAGPARTLKQSTFQGSPVDPARLGRRAASHVPRATATTRAAARALTLVEQGRTVEQIATQLAEEFAGQLDARAARELVGELCDWLGDQGPGHGSA
jgi:protein arginine N-methyltransferase 1